MPISVIAHATCSPRIGPGGYGVVILTPEGEFEMADHEEHTSKRRLELRALIDALRVVPDDAALTLVSSSEYVARAFTQRWTETWERKGWETADDDPVEHAELWQELATLIRVHESVRWPRVRRRDAGTQYDDVARALSRSAAAGFSTALRPLGSGQVRSTLSLPITPIRFDP